jgi:hypothetical protein
MVGTLVVATYIAPMDPDLFADLFASDLALEIKADFMELRNVGADVHSCTTHVISRYRNLLSDPNDGPVIFLTVAALQLREGRLQSTFRDAALDLIESGEALRAYRSVEPSLGTDRRSLLESLEAALSDATVVDD